VLTHSVLAGCYLGGAVLRRADLRSVDARGANFEHADLTDVRADDSLMGGVQAVEAKLAGASLVKASLAGAVLLRADLSHADLRGADLTGAKLEGAILTAAKICGVRSANAQLGNVKADWIDGSADGDGSAQLALPQALKLLSGEVTSKNGAAALAGVRYFGRRDVLKGATLDFGEGAQVEIESVFQECTIHVGRGTEVVVKDVGVLSDCQILGPGNLTVLGHVFGSKGKPSIVGASQLIVRKAGGLDCAIEQAEPATRFAFEPGSRLRVRITPSRERAAKE
jgi:hypothetical protein